jgi:predicted GIY-YIG superfamily endonuclease
MAKKRDTMTYELKDGKKVVYRGTTNDLERRAQEHKDTGKKFTNIVKTSPKMTENGAKKKNQRH